MRILKYYDNGKDYDVIDIVKDYGFNFNLGNVLKYICWVGKKGDRMEDLEKVLDYLLWEIEVIEL